MSKKDDIIGVINSVIENTALKNTTLKEQVPQLCEDNDFESAFAILSQYYKYDYDSLFKIFFKINAIVESDKTLTLLCRYLKSCTCTYWSLKRHGNIPVIITYISKIMKNVHKYSDETQYLFARTLEFLWAFGYKELNTIIFKLYQQLNCEDREVYTEKMLVKAMSFVYIIDPDNVSEMYEQCRDIKRELKSSKARHLMGLCKYYLGIAENYKKKLLYNPNEYAVFANIDFKDYMGQSAESGCKLAITYLQHHELNSETSSDTDFADSDADCELKDYEIMSVETSIS